MNDLKPNIIFTHHTQTSQTSSETKQETKHHNSQRKHHFGTVHKHLHTSHIEHHQHHQQLKRITKSICPNANTTSAHNIIIFTHHTKNIFQITKQLSEFSNHIVQRRLHIVTEHKTPSTPSLPTIIIDTHHHHQPSEFPHHTVQHKHHIGTHYIGTQQKHIHLPIIMITRHSHYTHTTRQKLWNTPFINGTVWVQYHIKVSHLDHTVCA